MLGLDKSLRLPVFAQQSVICPSAAHLVLWRNQIRVGGIPAQFPQQRVNQGVAGQRLALAQCRAVPLHTPPQRLNHPYQAAWQHNLLPIIRLREL